MASIDVGTKEDNRLLEYMFLGNSFHKLFPRTIDYSWDKEARKECIRVVNHVHTKKVHAQDRPPNQHEFQGSLGGMYLLRMYMIYYS